MLRLLRFREFRLLWLGGLISMIGDWALLAALPFEIYRRTGSTLATAGVMIAGLAPAIALLAGVIRLDVHGMLLVVVAQAVWNLAAGTELIRGRI
jgi:hypothetical protein